MKQLDILYVISIMPPYPGGGAVDFGCIISKMAGNYKNQFKRIRVLTERGCDKNKADNILEYHDILFNYDSVTNKIFWRQLVNYLIIIYYILFTKKDIIHIHARYVYAKYIGRIIWFALFVSPAKVIIDIRDKFYNNFGFGHNFIVCSKELLEYYSWLHNVIYIPVPIGFPSINKNIQPKKQIAYFGSIVVNKGILELIEGYKQYLKETLDPLELHFYGLNAIGKKFVKEINSIHSIKYFGSISHEEIFDKIVEYKAAILPSRSEGMPHICLETMYCNRIIVCHKSITSIVPYIPGQFVLNEITPDEIKRVLLIVELFNRQISYEYDFSVHYPQYVSHNLIKRYQQVVK